MLDSNKALYVLRLALERCSSPARLPFAQSVNPCPHGRPRSDAGRYKHYVTTAVRSSDPLLSAFSPDSTSRPTVTPWGPRHAASDLHYSDPSTFLEPSFLDDTDTPSACEYRAASLTLPPRQISPVRWPYTSTSPNNIHPSLTAEATPRRCDTLASLVVARDLKTARIVYDELSALHIGILRRALYLRPAIDCINGTPEGIRDFLFWFNLVPNRPATRAHTSLKKAYAPLVGGLLTHHANDVNVHVQVLLAAAHKGVVTALVGPMARHLVYLMSPEKMIKVMEGVYEAYLKSTTAQQSTSLRAQEHALNASRRVDEGWNSIARALRSVGYEIEAKRLVERKKEVEWQARTIQGLFSSQAANGQGSVAVDAAMTAPDSTATSRLHHRPKLVRAAHAARNTLLGPKALARLLDQLEQERPSLSRRIVQRHESLSSPQPSMRRSSLRLSARETLAHARMVALRDLDRHAQVVETFRNTFHWVGIPNHASIQLPTSSSPSDSSFNDTSIPSNKNGNSERILPAWLNPTSRPVDANQKLYPTATHLLTLFPSLVHLIASRNPSTGAAQTLSFIQALRFSIIAAAAEGPAGNDTSGFGTGIAPESSILPALSSILPSDITDAHNATASGIESYRIAPNLLPTATTFAQLMRTTCHLFGPTTGLALLKQEEAMVAKLLAINGSVYDGTRSESEIENSNEEERDSGKGSPIDDQAKDSRSDTRTMSRRSSSSTQSQSQSQSQYQTHTLLTSDRAPLLARLNLAHHLAPTLDSYNALLWSQAGKLQINQMRLLLDRMSKRRHLAQDARFTLLRKYGLGLQRMQTGDDGCNQIRMALEVLRVPKPDVKTMKGIAGVIERVGRVDEAEEIRVLIRAGAYGSSN